MAKKNHFLELQTFSICKSKSDVPRVRGTSLFSVQSVNKRKPPLEAEFVSPGGVPGTRQSYTAYMRQKRLSSALHYTPHRRIVGGATRQYLELDNSGSGFNSPALHQFGVSKSFISWIAVVVLLSDQYTCLRLKNHPLFLSKDHPCDRWSAEVLL